MAKWPIFTNIGARQVICMKMTSSMGKFDGKFLVDCIATREARPQSKHLMAPATGGMFRVMGGLSLPPSNVSFTACTCTCVQLHDIRMKTAARMPNEGKLPISL